MYASTVAVAATKTTQRQTNHKTDKQTTTKNTNYTTAIDNTTDKDNVLTRHYCCQNARNSVYVTSRTDLRPCLFILLAPIMKQSCFPLQLWTPALLTLVHMVVSVVNSEPRISPAFVQLAIQESSVPLLSIPVSTLNFLYVKNRPQGSGVVYETAMVIRGDD